MKTLPNGAILRTATLAIAAASVFSASIVLPGMGDAVAAPYCLLRKPQFGRPANCFEFYLADAARIDAGAPATTVGAACAATPIAVRQGWQVDSSFGGPHPDWRSGDFAMHVASPYHQDAYGCRLATSLGLSGAAAAGGQSPQRPATGPFTGTGGAPWGAGVAGAHAQPTSLQGGYYVFALKDVGLVIATQHTVGTRPVCDWSGGGPRPCQTAATVLGAFGGPYPSEDAARADMRSKLDCHRGHWGTFLPWGSGRFWLQNNLTASDCRSVRQL